MAESTLNLVKVITEVIVVEPRVTLVLSDEEAKVLATILGCVGGNVLKSKRSVSNKILWALEKSGYHYDNSISPSGTLSFPEGAL
jgi:hypothetical protein